jgi:L-cystine uptake protein TcyP (sodium:dicarboxylate symporter family)
MSNRRRVPKQVITIDNVVIIIVIVVVSGVVVGGGGAAAKARLLLLHTVLLPLQHRCHPAVCTIGAG